MPSPSTLGLVVVLPVAPVFAKNKCVFCKRQIRVFFKNQMCVLQKDKYAVTFNAWVSCCVACGACVCKKQMCVLQKVNVCF